MDKFNYLFLDIDGVLNTFQGQIYWQRERNKESAPEEELCPIACSNLQMILEEDPMVRIIISSSWRHGKKPDRMAEILDNSGVTLARERVIGETPVIINHPYNEERGHEIQQWLDKNKDTINKFAIIDDDADMAHLMKYLFQTKAAEGLTYTIAESILMHYGGFYLTFSKLEEGKLYQPYGWNGSSVFREGPELFYTNEDGKRDKLYWTNSRFREKTK